MLVYMGVSFTATIAVICTYQIVSFAIIAIFLFIFWQYRAAVATNNPLSYCHCLLAGFPIVFDYPYVQCFLCLPVLYDNCCRALSLYDNFSLTVYLQNTVVCALVACLCRHVLPVLSYCELHRFLCVEL